MKRRVVVTGIGMVTPLGGSVAETWDGMLAGRSGVKTIDFFDPTGLKTRMAGVASPGRITPRLPIPVPIPDNQRRIRFALESSRQAFFDAGLDAWEGDRERLGVSFAANESHYYPDVFGPIYAAAFADNRYDDARLMEAILATVQADEFLYQEAHHTVGLLSQQYGACGPVLSCLTACAAATQAIGEGLRMVERGEADICLAGGADSMFSPMKIIGFSLLGALSQRNDEPERASRPFDMTRDGFVLGEGGGTLVLEDVDHARARGARIYAELIGYGCYQEAHHLTGTSPEATGPTEAILRAMADGEIGPDAVGYINAHGTSTIENDAVETRAVKRAFGERAYRVPISSTKSMIGHLVAGSGAVEAIVTILALRDQIAPPTINLVTPDPDCDLDYVPNQARSIEADVALSNSFGFGGQNATLAFRRPKEDR